MQRLQCPQCSNIAEAYNSQIEGKQSIVCPRCGWHGYSNRTNLVIKNLPVIDIDRFLVGNPRYSPTRRRYKY